jgi:drug/metabolite transporter (DMT)-like permease
MNRGRALKVVLVLVGLLFTAGIYPATMILWGRDKSGYGDAMMLSLYFTLGIFLLLAVRNPSASASVISFAAWSSFAHGVVMAVLAFQIPSERGELLIAVAALVIIGVVLIALAPAKQLGERASAAGA